MPASLLCTRKQNDPYDRGYLTGNKPSCWKLKRKLILRHTDKYRLITTYFVAFHSICTVFQMSILSVWTSSCQYFLCAAFDFCLFISTSWWLVTVRTRGHARLYFHGPDRSQLLTAKCIESTLLGISQPGLGTRWDEQGRSWESCRQSQKF